MGQVGGVGFCAFGRGVDVLADEEQQCTHSLCLTDVLLAKVPGSQIRQIFASVLILFQHDQFRLENCVHQMSESLPLPPHLKNIFSGY